MSAHSIDVVWMLVQRADGRPPAVLYHPPGTSAREAWMRACQWDMVEGESWRPVLPEEFEMWRRGMRSAGWRAERVEIGVPQP